MRGAALAIGALVVLVSGCGGGSHPRPVLPAHESTPPPLGSLSSSGAGNRFYEIYDPVGAARGTMLLIHGGGWTDQRGDARKDMSSVALTLRAAGWRVVNISYTPGQKPLGVAPDPVPMLRDVVAFYDQVRRAFGDPICAYGQSAGAHLAAMLAVERPSLRCAILDAGPVDLPSLARETDPAGLSLIRRTFGTGQSTLAQWSPARDWRRDVDRTAVWATYADGDPVVPPQQGSVMLGADPSANVDDVPAGSFFWLHSSVDYGAISDRDIDGLSQWLDRIVPRAGARSGPRDTDIGGACDRPPPRGRFELMLAGDAWKQMSTPGQRVIAATRGCSGSGHWQDDGLSLWALPSTSARLPQGALASLTLDPGHVLHRLTVRFRGFLARPKDWVVGLYASRGTSGGIQTPVAACNRSSCSGLRLFQTGVRALIAPSGTRGDPDQSDEPPGATFTLPAGTRRIAWMLGCAAASGCSLKGIAKPRARDPLGHPAIFSIYSAKMS